jgi:hypothetical protein
VTVYLLSLLSIKPPPPTPVFSVLVVAACLGRYWVESRLYTGSDLNVFLTWCAGCGLDPLTVRRVEIERFVRWLQEARCYQPSTVSRRLPVGSASTGLRHRPDSAVLAGRLRAPAARPGRVSHVRAGTPGIRSLDHHRPLSANINDFALTARTGRVSQTNQVS